MKGPRGGGKSRILAGIEFMLWYLMDWDVVNLGGSLSQSEKVYSYLLPAFNSKELNPIIERSVQKCTEKKLPCLGKIFVLAATEKQTRSPHIGGAKRGGLLVVDEECEAEESVVVSALPVINTAHPSAILRSSTFHKSFGSYQKTWDNAGKLGYTKFEWDCFDVSEKCKDDCEMFKDPVSGKTGKCNVLDYCHGKAHGSEGWIPIEEIRQAKREMASDTFEVEMMGWRPSGVGLIFPPSLVQECISKDTFSLHHVGTIAIGVDWGFEGETSILQIQEQKDNSDKNKYFKRITAYEYFSRPKEHELYSYLEELSLGWRVPLYLDNSHKFQNEALTDLGANVTEVNFRNLKNYGITAIKKSMEDKELQIPESYTHLIDQILGYRMGKTGKPIKYNDHGVDALICALIHFTREGLGSSYSSRFRVVDPYEMRKRGSGYG